MAKGWGSLLLLFSLAGALLIILPGFSRAEVKVEVSQPGQPLAGNAQDKMKKARCIGCKLLTEEVYQVLSQAADQARQEDSDSVDVDSAIQGICDRPSYTNTFNQFMALTCKDLMAARGSAFVQPIASAMQRDPKLEKGLFLRAKRQVCSDICEDSAFASQWAQYALSESEAHPDPALGKTFGAKKSMVQFQDRGLNRCATCNTVVQDIVTDLYAARTASVDSTEELLEGVCAMVPLRHPNYRVLQDECDRLVETHAQDMAPALLKVLATASREKAQPAVPVAEQICEQKLGWCDSRALGRDQQKKGVQFKVSEEKAGASKKSEKKSKTSPSKTKKSSKKPSQKKATPKAEL